MKFDLICSKTGEPHTQYCKSLKVELCSSFVRLHSCSITMQLSPKWRTRVSFQYINVSMQMCRLSARNRLAALLRIYKRKQNITVIIHFRQLLCALMCGRWEPGTQPTPQLENLSRVTVHAMNSKLITSASLEVQIGNADEAFKHFMPGRTWHPSFQSGMESRNWSCWMWDLNGRVFVVVVFFWADLLKQTWWEVSWLLYRSLAHSVSHDHGQWN